MGMSLTGGLDTRMILAWHQAEPGSMPCYSFGGMFRDCEDVRLAREVAKACHQPFEVIPVGSEFLSKFAHYAERTVYLTDGCIPVRHASDLYVNERAAKIAPARMTGNYGGEILRQLRAFKPGNPASNLFRPELMNEVYAARSRYEKLVQGHALSFIAFRQVPWHHYGLLALEQSQLSLRSPFLDNDLVRTAYRSPLATTSDGNLFKESQEAVRLIADGSKDLYAIPTDRGLAGTSGKLMRNLTAQYLEFTFKAEYAYDYGMPQWLARFDHRVSSLHLEKLFLGRHKFNHFRVWYRDALSSYVRDILFDSRTLSRPYLNRASVEHVVNGHLKGDQNFTTEIHQLLTLELMHRTLVDNCIQQSSSGQPDSI
jgi:asparagine synthase (glutamine-hydrolysing)